jgi:NADP-dependent 3-hydroxy acid dehydrogenase YdfG
MERKMPIETNAVTPKKIAIVTGGSRGIGRNTVESLGVPSAGYRSNKLASAPASAT